MTQLSSRNRFQSPHHSPSASKIAPSTWSNPNGTDSDIDHEYSKVSNKNRKLGLHSIFHRIVLFFAILKTAFSQYSVDTLPYLLLPDEFRFPPALQYELGKFSLSEERKMRLVFLLVMAAVMALADISIVFLSYGTHLSIYYFVSPILLPVSILTLLLGFLFRKNVLYQNLLTIWAVSLIWISVWIYNVTEEGERLFTLVCFTGPLMTVMPLSFLKLLLSSFVFFTTGTTVVREKHLLVSIQYFLTSISISMCVFCLAYFNQLQYRRTFISQYFMNRRNQESKQLADRLDTVLLNILPQSIVEELSLKMFDEDGTSSESDATSSSGNHSSALHMSYDSATVMFVKILDFSDLILPLNASEIVSLLTEVYMEIDKIIEENGLYRIKTIQNNYLAVSGVPDSSEQHLQKAISAATKILLVMNQRTITVIGRPLNISIGLSSGPLVAGVIGISSYAYDIYGSTVNFSSRMCSTNSVRNSIQIPEELFEKLDANLLAQFACSAVPIEIVAKGFGQVNVRRIALHDRVTALNDTLSTLHGRSSTSLSHRHSIVSTHREVLENLMVDLKQQNARTTYDLNEIDKYEARIFNAQQNLPLARISSAIPDKFVQYERKSSIPSFKYFVPVIGCFRSHRLNMLYFKHTYRKFVTSNRVIFLVGLLLMLFTVANDFLNYSQTTEDNLKGMEYGVRYTVQQCANIPWENILVSKLVIAGFIFFITQLPIFTPLYSIHFVTFQFFSMTASLGGLVAIAIGLGVVCSDLFGQFSFLCYMLLVCSLQGVHPHIKSVTFCAALICYIILIIIPPIAEMGIENAIVSVFTNSLIFVALIGITNFSGVIAEGQSRNDFFFRGIGEKKRILIEKHNRKVYDILKSIFPSEIIEQVGFSGAGDNITAQYVESMSISYADICGFSKWSATKSAKELVSILSTLFSQFDIIAERHKVYRLQLVGDNYVGISGCPTPDKNHHVNIVRFVLEANRFVLQAYRDITFRFGVHCGHAVAGILQTLKQQYCVFGMLTTIGELMEQTGVGGRVQISSNMHHHLERSEFNEFVFEARKEMIVSDVLEQPMQTYFVEFAEEERGEMSVNVRYKGRRESVTSVLSPAATPMGYSSEFSDTDTTREEESEPVRTRTERHDSTEVIQLQSNSIFDNEESEW